MDLLLSILAILGGLVAASSFVIARSPDSRRLFERLAPYQGLVGVAMLAVGTVWLVRHFAQIGGLLKAAPLTGGVTVAAVASTILVGLLLGHALVARLLGSRGAAARDASARAVERLAAVQAPLGLAAAGLGVATIVL